jgi:hypothetical protein
MHPIEEKAERLADMLLDRARDQGDIEAATMLKKTARAYVLGYDVARAKTHEQSKAAYAALVDLMNGKVE